MKSSSLLAFTAFFGLLLCPVASAQDAEKPNVLMILVDDLKPTIGAYGDPHAITPYMDRLANAGARFDNAYCNQAVCAPSRINLLTGMRSSTSGIFGLSRGLRDLHPNAKTLPQAFREAGYLAESIGKVFHVGHGNHGDPVSWSTPPWHESPIDYAMIESTGGVLTREEALFLNWDEGDPWKLPRGAAWERAAVEDDVYADGRIAREAVRRLSRYAAEDTQFFLAVGFTNPHLPFAAPDKYWAMYDPSDFELPTFLTPPEGAPRFAGKNNRGEMGAYTPVPQGTEPLDPALTRTLIHGYYASTSYMDAQLGLVLDELERTGLDENTIVVLWGDHGFHLGDHGIWTKHTNYEQATRIPIVFAGPGIDPSEPVSFAESVDIMPTLLELADVGAAFPQQIDGVSLTAAWQDPGTPVRTFARHEFRKGQRTGYAIRTEQYRLVRWIHDNPNQPIIDELYDFVNDPLETKNIAAENPDVVRSLAALLDEDKKTGLAPVPLFADPNYHGSCDPEIVWNAETGEWLIFYTARRALAADGRTPAGTPIGVAASKDWRKWRFLGYCAFDGLDNTPDAGRTYWAPGVVADGDKLRMFVTYKPQATGFWGGQGEGIRHYEASLDDPLTWTLVNTAIVGNDAIDAGLLRVGDQWLMAYRDKPAARGQTSFLATSPDLETWTERGLMQGDINDVSANGHTYHEAQFIFRWKGTYWLLTDPSGPGLTAFRSSDARNWEFANDFMVESGRHPTDSNAGRHPSVVIVDDRAFLFYHVEPDRPEGPYDRVPRERRRTFLQVAELEIVDGELIAHRDRPPELPSPEALRRGPDRLD